MGAAVFLFLEKEQTRGGGQVFNERRKES